MKDDLSRGDVRCRPGDWLPPQLLQHLGAFGPAKVELSLDGRGEETRVVGRLAGGGRLVGAFTLENGKVKEVTVRNDP